MSSSIDNTIASDVKLNERKDWPTWYTVLQLHCVTRGIWDYVNPDAQEAPDFNRIPIAPNAQRMIDAINIERRTARAEWRAAQSTINASSTSSTPGTQTSIEVGLSSIQRQLVALGPEPTSSLATITDVKDDFNLLASDHSVRIKERIEINSKQQQIMNFVQKTVSKNLLLPLTTRLLATQEATIQKIVQALRDHLAPTETSTITTVRKEYKLVLNKAYSGRINQQAWYWEWQTALVKAQLYNIPEIQGQIAIVDFLQAIREKYSPDWATRKLENLLENEESGVISANIETMGRLFHAVSQESTLRSGGGKPSINAVFGNRLEDHQGTTYDRDQGHNCPCYKERKHYWKPTECSRLQLAITGTCDRELQDISISELNQIKQRASQPKWKWVIDKKS